MLQAGYHTGRKLFFLVTLSLFLVAAPVGAQEDEASPGDGTAKLEELIQTIRNPEERERLVGQLEMLLEARGERPAAAADEEERDFFSGALGLLDDLTRQIRETLAGVVRQAARVPGRVRGFAASLENPEQRRRVLGGAAYLLGLAVFSLLVLLASRHAMRWPRERLAQPGEEVRASLWSRCWRLLALALLETLPVAALVGAGFLLLSILRPSSPVDRLLLLGLGAIAIRRIARVVIELITAPGAPALRLVAMTDERGKGVTRSLSAIASAAVYGIFLIRVAEVLGADPELLHAARGFYGLILLAMGSWAVLRYRRPVRAWLLERRRALKESPEGGASSFLAAFLVAAAGLWWLVALLYMLALYMTWASGLPGGFEFLIRASAVTAGVLLAAIVAVALIAVVLAKSQGATESALSTYPALKGRIGGYFSALRMILNLVVAAVAVSLAAEAWGLAALTILQSAAVLALVSSGVRVIVIVFLASAVLDLATVFTQRYLSAREDSGRATAKIKTLVPLVRSVVKILVIVVAGIMVLSEVGIEIGPILAGVGVLGLAVGFGAQTLVKDIITGFFILVEDSISVGDVAVLAGQGGLVERVNLRTVRLRDLSGNVHVIPYSAVGTITNMTKEFSYYLIEAGVAYREDTDEVAEVLALVLEEMRGEAKWGRDILEPLEVLGVDRFTDSAVIVRARIKTTPIRQWAVGREFNRRMKKAFDERGIEIPFPHRTIYMGESKEGEAPPLHVEVAEQLSRGESGDS